MRQRRQPADGRKPAQGRKYSTLPAEVRGFEIAPSFIGMPGETHSIGWSADGSLMAAAGAPGKVFLWSNGAGSPPELHDGPNRPADVRALAWHPSRPRLAIVFDDGSLWLWDVAGGSAELLYSLDGLGFTGLAWAPDGSRFAISDEQGGVGIRHAENASPISYRRVHQSYVNRVCWSRGGQVLVTCGRDGMIAGLDVASLQWRHEIREAPAIRDIRDITVSADDIFASSSDDNSVRIWDLFSGRLDTVLEGHHDLVMCVRFSPDGEFLASGSAAEVRLWRRQDWECVATIPGHNGQFAALDFHPLEPVLAAKNSTLGRIDCYKFDRAILGRITTRYDSRRYVNAKVVLVGDTGVGKTGLGLVLSGQQYAKTESSHGRYIWMFDADEVEVSGAGTQTREILLWDLAGQPSYRLVHQLHLHEVAIALVVFDSRSETDPFVGVKHWVRALAQARRIEGPGAPPLRTFLVAARADRGGVSVARSRVQAVVDEFGLDGFFETSAKEGWQIAELTQAVRAGIAWDDLPMVSSSALFESIKQFLLEEKEAGRILSTAGDLFHGFRRAQPHRTDLRSLRLSFETCIGLVQSQGLIRRLSFGDLVLLQPELLDTYASALIQAAKAEPDGLGFISEEAALQGQFRLSESDRISDRDAERLLLIATIEELLRHEIALKEATDQGVDLVFPSQFTRERPDAPDIPGKQVIFTFEGALYSIYASLAVRLSRSRLFERQAMWENAASYTATVGGVCGFHLRELEEGRGEFTVFYDEQASSEVRIQFESYISEYLHFRAISNTVSVRRILACANCGYSLPDDLVQRRRQMQKGSIRCPLCEQAVISLLDGSSSADAELTDSGKNAVRAVSEMNRSADMRRDQSVAATQLRGKVEMGDFDVFLCYNSKDREHIIELDNKLKDRGILPWLDVRDIPPGARWQKELGKVIKSVRSVAVFLGPNGPGPWQDMEVEAALQDMRRRRIVIPVILPGRKGNPRWPAFLSAFHVVDMRQPNPDPFEQLVWAITGQKPG